MKKTVWSSVGREPYNYTLTYRILLTVGLLCLLEGGGCLHIGSSEIWSYLCSC